MRRRTFGDRRISILTAALLLMVLPASDASAQTRELHNDSQAARQLNAVLEHGDTAQLSSFIYDFERGTGSEWQVPLNPDIEREIVGHFRDERWRKPLMQLLVGHPYASRELFDLINQHIADPDKVDANMHWYDLICRTQQRDVEAPLLAVVPKLNTEGGRYAILSCLAGRKYTAAVPAIVRYIAATRGSPTDYIRQSGYGFLGHIGSREAAAALIAELKRIRKIPAPTAGDLADQGAALQALSDIPKDTPLDTALVVSLVSGDKVSRSSFLKFLKARPEPVAANTLIGYLSDEALRKDALEILRQMESPEAWTGALHKVEELHAAGKLPDASYQSVKQMLSMRIEHPDVLRQQQHMYAANEAVDKGAQPLRGELHGLSPLVQSDPGRYVEQAIRITDALEAVADRHVDAGYSKGVRSEVVGTRSTIALVQRFILRQPLKAIETNQKILASQDALGETPDLLAALQIAEIYQHELADKSKAIEYYRKARDTVDRQNWGDLRNPQAVTAWWKEGLIDREIGFLTTGAVFSGAVTRRDVEGVGVAFMYGEAALLALIAPSLRQVSEAPADPAVLARLRQMPASYLTTMAAIIDMNGAADAAAVVDLLEREDPVHYVSASVLGLYAASENQEPGADARAGGKDDTTMLRQVIAGFGRATRIAIHTEPDPRRATPQATWELFIASLRSGDRDTAIACFTGQLQTSLSELFRKSSNADLQRMASEFGPLLPSNFSGVSSGELKEFGVTRKTPQGDQAAFVYFAHEWGEWVVQSM